MNKSFVLLKNLSQIRHFTEEMNASMKLFRALALFAFAVVLALGTASAATINGSIPFAGIGLSINGADLAASTIINAVVYETSGVGAGDYSAIPILTNFTEGGGLDLTNLSAFTFTNATYGTFVADGVGDQILTQNANFLDIYLRGTFTPAVALGAGLLPTDTSFRISFTKSGSSVSGSGTLNSPAAPPPGVPEPATMTLFGSALVGLGLIGRKRLARR